MPSSKSFKTCKRLQYVTEFHRYLDATVAPLTATAYKQNLPRLDAFLVTRGPLATLATAPRGFMRDYVVWLLQGGVRVGTAKNNYFAAIKYANWLRDFDDKTFIPTFIAPDFPREPKRPGMTLRSDKDILDYLVCLDTTLSDDGKPLREPYLTMFRVWPFCGLRLDEMVSLQREHVGETLVDTVEGVVPWRVFHVARGKGSKFRDVGVLPAGGFALRAYMKAWIPGRDGTSLWPISRGSKPVGRTSVMRRFKWVAKRYGARITSHTMRRTYATLLVRKGVPIETVSAMLGHENIQTTINFYVSLGLEDHLRKIGKAFNMKSSASEVDPTPDSNPQTAKEIP